MHLHFHNFNKFFVNKPEEEFGQSSLFISSSTSVNTLLFNRYYFPQTSQNFCPDLQKKFIGNKMKVRIGVEVDFFVTNEHFWSYVHTVGHAAVKAG